MAKKKRLTIPCVSKDVEELELSCGSNGSCRMVQLPWEILCQVFFLKTIIHLPFDIVIFHTPKYPREKSLYINLYINMYKFVL